VIRNDPKRGVVDYSTNGQLTQERPLKPPTKTIDVPDEREKKKHRHGRPRKTGRPGQ
jgi:hypothetical protein